MCPRSRPSSTVSSPPRKGGRPPRFIGLDNYAHHAGRSGLLAGARATTCSMPSVTDPGLDRAGAGRWRSGSTASIRGARRCALAYFTPTMLPMVAVANIWLFFYTPDYGLLDQILGVFGVGSAQLARQRRDRAAGADGADDLEGGRLLHDLLPGGAAAACRRTSRRRRRWKAPSRWNCLPPRHLAAADADHAVRAGQCRHQRLPRRRPDRRDDRAAGRTTRPRCCCSTSTRSASASGTPATPRRCRPCCWLVLAAIAPLQFCLLGRRVHYR